MEMIAAISNWVDTIAVNPVTAQTMPVETRSRRVAPRNQEPAGSQAKPRVSSEEAKPAGWRENKDRTVWDQGDESSRPTAPRAISLPLFSSHLVPDWGKEIMAYLKDGV